ncbi:hypothetical protein [Mangrovihabitans endophyticus]|uniref:Uncharacterized protein n=1 Tax=Mangrovihabitans endophyticus TaxID=1751298 RepID=A0A8J3FS20_9ACTN|nr:hypothetical protein [Mangrovihabitans endophyticus]GGL16377.1 hypothetical protein GCM10012284_58700 [Mangrovihabitans endophyticus]
MSARTTARLRRAPTEHTGWCARDHTCGIDTHRARPVVTARGTGRAVMTRTRAGDVDYAEVLIRIPLHRNENTARTQLALLLRLLGELLDTLTTSHLLPGRTRRPALDRRHSA